MSVTGEFQRALSEYSGLLRGTGSGAGALASALSEAARLARKDVCGAAERTLDALAEGSEPPVLGSELECEELARASEHLGAICRVILGR